jgi:hypothetical protein
MQIDPNREKDSWCVAGPISGVERMKYQITVQGHLDSKWATWFEGMEITSHLCRDDEPCTVLTGVVADQPALHGILARIRDLNLILVSVCWLDAGSSERVKGE